MDVDAIVTAVVVAVLGFVAGWMLKGLGSLEQWVLASKTKADDEILKKIKEVLADWVKPVETPKK